MTREELSKVFNEKANEHYHRYGLSNHGEGEYMRVKPYDAMTESVFMETVSKMLEAKDADIAMLKNTTEYWTNEASRLRAYVERLTAELAKVRSELYRYENGTCDNCGCSISLMPESTTGQVVANPATPSTEKGDAPGPAPSHTEDVCECQTDNSDVFPIVTSCGYFSREVEKFKNGNKCPYCGKPIKLAEKGASK